MTGPKNQTTPELSVEHAVVALVLPVQKLDVLESRLDEVMAKAVSYHQQLVPTAELHGYEIASGEESWEGVPIRARLRTYRRALREIVGVEGVAMCRGSVNLSNKNPADGHAWALTIALEQVNQLAQSLDEHVIGICDDVGNKAKYQQMYADARRNGTGGYYPSCLERFVDGLHFTPSCHSRLVQAVDLLTYVYRRQFMVPYQNPKAAKTNEQLWQLIHPVVSYYCRTWS